MVGGRKCFKCIFPLFSTKYIMRTIIVIDDEPIVIKGVQAILDRIESDYTIIASTNNGLEGYEMLLEKKPDVALVDIKIPGIDGLELIEALDELPNTAFIVMSGFQDFKYIQTAMRLGVLDYIDKPVTVSKLSAALEKANRFFAQKCGFDTKIAMQFSDYIGINITAGDTQKLKDSFSASYKEMVLESGIEAANNTFYLILCRLLYRFTNTDMYFYLYRFHNVTDDPDSINNMAETDFLKMIDFISSTICEKTANETCVIDQVKEYVDLHFYQQLSLSGLGERFGINPAYLSVRFHEVTGENFSKYLTSKRINLAKELLHKDIKVSEIAEKVGYYNYRYFCDVFKKETGLTPTDYRRLIAK